MRLGMVIGMQNEILIGIKKLPLYVSFQNFKWKETSNNSFIIPIRISFCIPMTISSLSSSVFFLIVESTQLARQLQQERTQMVVQ